MSTMPEPQVLVTLGVDTHADTHVAAALDQLGRHLGTITVATITRGFGELVEWASQFGIVVVEVLDAVFVGDHASPDAPSDLAFQAAHRFVVCLALGDLAVVVAASFAVAHPHLCDRDEMQRLVQLPVAATREPVSCAWAAGDLDGRSAGVGGVRRLVGEP